MRVVLQTKQNDQDQLPWNKWNNAVQMWQAYLFKELIIQEQGFMTVESSFLMGGPSPTWITH